MEADQIQKDATRDTLRRKSPKFTITLPSDIADKVYAEGGKTSQVIAKRLRQAYAQTQEAQ